MFTPFKKFTNSILVCSIFAIGGCPYIPGNPKFDVPNEWQGEGGDISVTTPAEPETETETETETEFESDIV